MPFLGAIPIDPAIRAGGDEGMPIVVADPDSPQTKSFKDIAAKIVSELKQQESGSASGGGIASLLNKNQAGAVEHLTLPFRKRTHGGIHTNRRHRRHQARQRHNG
ncbi:MAG: P-loop NTPase [Nitrospirota bacterium]